MNFPEFEHPESDDNSAPFSFNFEDVSIELPDTTRLTEWLTSVTQEENARLVEVAYIFCSDEYLLDMNREYLQHDYYTDVITFPYDDDAVHGDIFISTDRVADNAQTNGISFTHELCRVMVHGVLHLAGYGDKTDEDAALMRQKEDYYLKKAATESGPLSMT